GGRPGDAVSTVKSAAKVRLVTGAPRGRGRTGTLAADGGSVAMEVDVQERAALAGVAGDPDAVLQAGGHERVRVGLERPAGDLALTGEHPHLQQGARVDVRRQRAP